MRKTQEAQRQGLEDRRQAIEQNKKHRAAVKAAAAEKLKDTFTKTPRRRPKRTHSDSSGEETDDECGLSKEKKDKLLKKKQKSWSVS